MSYIEYKMRLYETTLCTFCAILYCAFHTNQANGENSAESDINSDSWGLFAGHKPGKSDSTLNWNKKTNSRSGDMGIRYIHRKKFNSASIPLHSSTYDQSKAVGLPAFVTPVLHRKTTSKYYDKKEGNVFLTYLTRNISKIIADDYKNYKMKNLKCKLPNQKPKDSFVINRNASHSQEEQLKRSVYYEANYAHGLDRQKRSAAKLVHKLIRLPPSNVTESTVDKGNTSINIKLNTSSFASPHHTSNLLIDISNTTTLSYEQIEDLALSDLNGTDIMENINDTDEHLPNPEELVSGHRYRGPNKHRTIFAKGDAKRKRIPLRTHQMPLLQKRCERFTASMCIKAEDYPMEQIMGSIRRHKNAMSALLAEYHDKAAELEYQEQLEEYQFNSKRREDGNVITPGGMCASIVRYARPQKARSAAGEWKYIVNTGHHTQTLRLEKCSTPQESCSYLSHNYRSRCTQVYNYHRLLSWDKSRGLHVDIFKVPTCCSCQVDGYKETFPPMGGTKHKSYKDYTPVPSNNPYVSFNEEINYEDDDDEDGPTAAYQFHSGLKKSKYDSYPNSDLLLGSTNIKSKVNTPRLIPTVGSYLSPPTDTYDSQLVTKSVGSTYFTHSNKVVGSRSRKPYKTYIPSESRVDLEISGSEQSDKEVKAIPINESHRIHQKRTRLYSEPSSDSSKVSTDLLPNHSTTESTVTNIRIMPSTKSTNIRKETSNNKRINYSYHPIIDFFENHQKSPKVQTMARNSGTNSVPISTEVITSRDRRIAFGISGIENNWHPVVINS